MDILLVKATAEDAQEIHQMQVKAFKRLLDKYQDYDTNPGNETVEKVLARINQETTDFFLIKMDKLSVGAIRINKLENGWILDTILQEAGNCHLYEKIGYKRTGKTEKINEKMDIVYYEK